MAESKGMDDYEKYETACKCVRENNAIFLNGFQRCLESRRLSGKTIDRHVSNIDFYINDFLLYEEPLEAVEGVSKVDDFLGYWFIRKAMWASPTSIKENIASLKHFYAYMNKIGQVTEADLSDMKEEIKECKDEWIETLQRYDDPDTSLDDVWG